MKQDGACFHSVVSDLMCKIIFVFERRRWRSQRRRGFVRRRSDDARGDGTGARTCSCTGTRAGGEDAGAATHAAAGGSAARRLYAAPELANCPTRTIQPGETLFPLRRYIHQRFWAFWLRLLPNETSWVLNSIYRVHLTRFLGSWSLVSTRAVWSGTVIPCSLACPMDIVHPWPLQKSLTPWSTSVHDPSISLPCQVIWRGGRRIRTFKTPSRVCKSAICSRSNSTRIASTDSRKDSPWSLSSESAIVKREHF